MIKNKLIISTILYIFNFEKMEQVDPNVDKVQYITYDNLNDPQMTQISDSIIQLGFQSRQWTIQFQTVTTLRRANKYYSATFMNELLPKFYKSIIQQVQNLRSNNSKQALTLLTQIFTHQQLNKLNAAIMKPFINILFIKSVSQKGFLKSQALKAINKIPNIQNVSVTQQLMSLTKSNNGMISELAIKTINQMFDKNQTKEVNEKFLKDLSFNINGKRSVVQKQAKQILVNLKKRVGQQKLQQIIENASELDPEQSNTLKRELKKIEPTNTKSGGNFRDFIKMKKVESTETS